MGRYKKRSYRLAKAHKGVIKMNMSLIINIIIISIFALWFLSYIIFDTIKFYLNKKLDFDSHKKKCDVIYNIIHNNENNTTD